MDPLNACSRPAASKTNLNNIKKNVEHQTLNIEGMKVYDLEDRLPAELKSLPASGSLDAESPGTLPLSL